MPYRDSKLTRLLKNALQVGAPRCMWCMVPPGRRAQLLANSPSCSPFLSLPCQECKRGALRAAELLTLFHMGLSAHACFGGRMRLPMLCDLLSAVLAMVLQILSCSRIMHSYALLHLPCWHGFGAGRAAAKAQVPISTKPWHAPLPQDNCMTSMIAALNPAPENFEECFNTLQVGLQCVLVPGHSHAFVIQAGRSLSPRPGLQRVTLPKGQPSLLQCGAQQLHRRRPPGHLHSPMCPPLPRLRCMHPLCAPRSLLCAARTWTCSPQ